MRICDETAAYRLREAIARRARADFASMARRAQRRRLSAEERENLFSACDYLLDELVTMGVLDGRTRGT